VRLARLRAGLGLDHHPRSADTFRSFVADRSLIELIAIFALVLLTAGLLAGLGYEITDDAKGERSFLAWWKEGLVALTGNPLSDAAASGGSAGRGLVQAAVAFSGTVLPALFLGSIVFKLLVAQDVFVLRDRISIVPNADYNGPQVADPQGLLKPDGHHLAIRLYSATKLRLIDVRCVAHLHAEVGSQGSERGQHYFPLCVVNNSWPLAHPHIPYTVRIPLNPGEERLDSEGGRLSIQDVRYGHPDDFIVMTLTARAPDLGMEFSETHIYSVPESITHEPFGSVSPQPHEASRDWVGWAGFDDGRCEGQPAYRWIRPVLGLARRLRRG